MINPMNQVAQGFVPAGTQVGNWRVVEVLGKGAYGVVYGAERVASGEAGSFALKMASSPDDPRFEREVELLSRVRHGQVPKLHDHGWWIHSSGVAFPFLVMDRIEGRLLYEWASGCNPSSRQVMRVLADLAWALDATHRADCVHRDVKGENVLVSAEGRAYLMDFGAGDFKGARTLTRDLLPPGTPHYRSPQALRFQWAHRHEPGAHYEPGPADDVYALGVTAYILVTGACPPCGVDLRWEADPTSVPPPPPLAPPSAFVTVSPDLDVLIMRMLVDAPEARGSAGEVAQALEHALHAEGLVVDAASASDQPESSLCKPSRIRPSRIALGAAIAVGGVSLVASAWWIASPNGSRSTVVHDLRNAKQAKQGTVGLGDEETRTITVLPLQWTPATGLGRDMPNNPFPGQRLPPCRDGFEVEIELTEGQKDTRSCWIKGNMPPSACKAHGYEYRGNCYAPSYPPPKLPQSVRP